nr:transmembrane protein 135 isoform X1 [Ciona intestinalis]|eukprot:XP_002129471.2 transmembrane protein 135 isoform X1 [Ciona intestinalis]
MLKKTWSTKKSKEVFCLNVFLSNYCVKFVLNVIFTKLWCKLNFFSTTFSLCRFLFKFKMTLLSKPLNGCARKQWTDSVPYTCYEIGHTWEPRCTIASLDTIRDSLKFSLKVYLTFYTVTGLVKLRNKKHRNLKEIRKLFRDVLQSSVFLSANGVLFMSSFCFFRHLFGKFYGWHGLLCGFVAGYFSLIIERKSRRGALALYLTNLSAEIIFRAAKSNGLVHTIPNGEVLLFSLASAGFMSLFRQRDGLPESIQTLVQYLVGKVEGHDPVTNEVKCSKVIPGRKTLLFLKKMFNRTPKHWSCPHQYGCLGYIIQGCLPRFAVGYGVEMALNILQVIRGRKKIKDLIRISGNLSLAMFLGGFSLLFRLTNCILRWLHGKDSPQLFGAISGLVAGSSFYFYKSPTIALYAMFKLLHILLLKLVDKGYLPDIPNIERYIYATMLAIILHTACVGPQFMRPGYWRFISGVSGEKFPFMFRKLMVPFASQAMTLYPDFIPNLNPQFVKTPEVLQILAEHGKLSGAKF